MGSEECNMLEGGNTTKLKGESQRQDKEINKTDIVNMDTLHKNQAIDQEKTITHQQTKEQNKKISPHINGWIKSVENHGDLKWRNFKKLQLDDTDMD